MNYTFQDDSGSPGLVVTDGKTQLALTRLAVCLEELFDCGLQEAKFWILPVCRK